MSPPFHLRRIYFLWSPLFVAGAISFALIGAHYGHAGLWVLIPTTLTAWAITAELTEHKETTA